MKNILVIRALAFLFIVGFLGCGVSKKTITQTYYVDTNKKPQKVEISVEVPNIKLMDGTTQLQKKGDVTVICELFPFNIIRLEKKEEAISYLDPHNTEYDVFELSNKPYFEITPEEIQFNIKIRNNQDRVLKLVEVPIILIVDGIQTNIADELLVDWKGALIPKGFEKEFLIHGPGLNTLQRSKSIYIAVHDVPTSYDQAGTIKKKENFEWTFSVENEKIIKNDEITYKYEKRPIHKEQCKSCSGQGKFVKTEKCKTCNGSGSVKNKEGKVVKCSYCGGAGKINYEEKCETCNGKGIIAFPKSTQKPPIAKEVVWTSWEVNVESIPTGARVKAFDINTGEYKDFGRSNLKIPWCYNSNNTSPIILELNNKSIKVLPYDKEGKEIGTIVIDFSNQQNPQVIEGKTVN
jgi:hypothetical protein